MGSRGALAYLVTGGSGFIGSHLAEPCSPGVIP